MARIDDGSGQAVRTAHALRAEAGTALYVHLPFCEAKCTYCDFFSIAAEGEDLPGTIDAMLVEAEARAPARPRTVFFGGGTPSLYESAELTRLFDGLDRLTDFRSSAQEVTVECNPESLERDKARALRELGADRLSIGFQSLDPAILELFGRVHDVDASFRAFEAARSAGFERVSVDLIYAAPGQTLERWLDDLDRVLALGPDHVSAYHLAYEDGTALTQWLAEGRVQRHTEELELDFLLATRESLEGAGHPAYEISNFASDDQQCRHNINYWHNGPYVGLGPSAVSKVEHTRFGNPRSVGGWRRSLEERGWAAAWEETPTPLERLAETWWLGLRLRCGVDPGVARSTSGFEPSGARVAGSPEQPTDSRGLLDPAEELARSLAQQGWLTQRGTRWSLAPRGLPLADAIARRFLSIGSAGHEAEERVGPPGR